MHTSSEEDYLKAIYKLNPESGTVSTNAIAEELHTKASSVTDMIKKLAEKELVHYVKYQGVTLTKQGKNIALMVIRKHRLWESFLVETLNFTWDEIHEVAEQLEHIQSVKLINKLDEHLGFPKYDPHGDPIPDQKGKFHQIKEALLSTFEPGEKTVLLGVKDHSKEFLQYLEKLKLLLGTSIEVLDKYLFDGSMKIRINQKQELMISSIVAKNLTASKNNVEEN